MFPNVSFVIPALNAQKTISKTIQSIKAQDYSGQFDIIVVDNGSDDDTGMLSEEAGARVIKVSKRNRSLARNTGYKLSRSEFIAFIDADVFLDQSWLTEMMKGFTHPSIAGGQGQVIPVNLTHNSSLEKFRMELSDWRTYGTFNSLKIISHSTPMVNTAACLYRKEALDQVNGFDENLNRHEDIDLSKRISINGHHFTASLTARAFVAWQGSGWIDYLGRSFEVGLCKKSFDEKWNSHTKHFQRYLALQVKNIKLCLETKNTFWLKKSVIETLMELGRCLSVDSYPLRAKQSYNKGSAISLIIFPDRVHVLEHMTGKVTQLEAYHAIPYLHSLEIISTSEMHERMKALLGTDFDASIIPEVENELKSYGILKGKI